MAAEMAAGVPSCNGGGDEAAASTNVVPAATSMLQPAHRIGEAAAGSASGPCVPHKCTRKSTCRKPAGHLGCCHGHTYNVRFCKRVVSLRPIDEAGEVSGSRVPAAGTVRMCTRTTGCPKAAGHTGFCTGHPYFKPREESAVRTQGVLLNLCRFQVP